MCMVRTEVWVDPEREETPDLPVFQGRRESLERMGHWALMDPRGLLELQVREAWWAFQGPEEREA